MACAICFGVYFIKRILSDLDHKKNFCYYFNILASTKTLIQDIYVLKFLNADLIIFKLRSVKY